MARKDENTQRIVVSKWRDSFGGARGEGEGAANSPGFFAYFLMSTLSESMKYSPQWSSMEAVPRRTNLPLPVTGLAVMPRLPAAVPSALSMEVPGLRADEVGLANPLTGLPVVLTGLPVRVRSCPDAVPIPVPGLLIEVPGRGICARAFSSKSWSPKVSSSSSMSSSQSIAVKARHLRYQNDSSYGFLRAGENKAQ